MKHLEHWILLSLDIFTNVILAFPSLILPLPFTVYLIRMPGILLLNSLIQAPPLQPSLIIFQQPVTSAVRTPIIIIIYILHHPKYVTPCAFGLCVYVFYVLFFSPSSWGLQRVGNHWATEHSLTHSDNNLFRAGFPCVDFLASPLLSTSF